MACAGKQHQPPGEDTTDAATVVFKGSSIMGSSMYALQFDARGCVQGQTGVPRAGTSRPMRLVPGEEKFFLVETEGSKGRCRSAVSFVPEPGARYQIVDQKFSGGFGKPDACAARVQRVDDAGATSSASARSLRIQQVSMACHRVMP